MFWRAFFSKSEGARLGGDDTFLDLIPRFFQVVMFPKLLLEKAQSPTPRQTGRDVFVAIPTSLREAWASRRVYKRAISQRKPVSDA